MVNLIAYTRQITQNNRANAFVLTIFQECGGMFMESIFDLVVNLFDAFPLTPCDFPPTFTMTLALTYRMAEFR